MELRQLRSLIALIDGGLSVTRAARTLHLVQPAVSQHLRQLEEELGTPLFLRRGKRLVGLTGAGEEVARWRRRSASRPSAGIMWRNPAGCCASGPRTPRRVMCCRRC